MGVESAPLGLAAFCLGWQPHRKGLPGRFCQVIGWCDRGNDERFWWLIGLFFPGRSRTDTLRPL